MFFKFLSIISFIFYFILYFLFMQNVMHLKHFVTKLIHQSKRARNSPAWVMWRTAITIKATQIFIFSTVGLIQSLKAPHLQHKTQNHNYFIHI